MTPTDSTSDPLDEILDQHIQWVDSVADTDQTTHGFNRTETN